MIADVSTLEEAADYLRVTPRRLKTLIHARQIGYVKQGRDYTFPKAALEAYLETNTAIPIPANAFGLSPRSATRLNKSP